MRFSSACIDGSQTLASRFFVYAHPPLPASSPLTLRSARMGDEKRRKKLRALSGFAVQKMDIKELTDRMHTFVTSKGWYGENSQRPQTPRNLAISLALEAAEILEQFQWSEEVKDRKDLSSELADAALYLLQLASISEIDLEQAILDKLEVNKTREWDQE